MKNIARLTAALALVLVFGSKAEAQYVDDWFWGINYSMAAPLGDTKDFTGSFSLMPHFSPSISRTRYDAGILNTRVSRSGVSKPPIPTLAA